MLLGLRLKRLSSKLKMTAVIMVTALTALGIIYYLTLPPVTAPEEPPQILSHTSYLTEVDSIKFFTVVGEVQNNLKTNIESVKVVATFYDTENDVVGTRFTYTELKILESEQKAPFEVYLLLNSTVGVPAGYDLTLSYIKTSEEAVADLEVVNRTSRIDSNGYYGIWGEVQNSGKRKAFTVKLICTYYDSEGKVMAVSNAYVSSEMDAGEKVPFEISSRPHRISPASYELLVVTHHYEPLLVQFYELLVVLIVVVVIFVVFMKRRGW